MRHADPESLFFDKYIATVVHHPLAYLRVVANNFNYFALGELIADPVATVNQFLELGSSHVQWRIPGLSLRNLAALWWHFDAGRLILMLLSALAEAISAIVFSLYIFGTPFALLRSSRQRGTYTKEWTTVAFLWCCFVGVSFAFSLVHYEARHALPLSSRCGRYRHAARRFRARYSGSARGRQLRCNQRVTVSTPGLTIRPRDLGCRKRGQAV